MPLSHTNKTGVCQKEISPSIFYSTVTSVFGNFSKRLILVPFIAFFVCELI